MSDSQPRNRLADETSPYLLQHASNPVEWHPWDETALARARELDRPILLSVGYAACHWCHVMERESFENADTAAQMNESFVCIKVDREERPDVDDVYMRAVQMMIGSGGWPLTVFLTPDLKPFYGGTYFPPEPRMGMPSFRGVLQGVAEAWENRRDEIHDVGGQLASQLQARHEGTAGDVDRQQIRRAVAGLLERFDPNHGGFGGAPKFPNSTSLSLLLRHGWRESDGDAIDAATFSLGQMAAGGIHDHLGGGFHRYTVDARWLVPHFEKMLYDNALLAATCLDAARLEDAASGHSAAVQSIFDWALREMVTPEGAFAATLDADSEGVEGKFYVWSAREIEAVLGHERAATFSRAYDVTPGGNWEGRVILNLPRPLDRVAADLDLPESELRARLDADRRALLDARSDRVRPGLDDKVLADWNGLMITALALGHRTLGEVSWLAAAEAAARFVLGPMRDGGGLRHSWRDGRPGPPGFLDDYAAMLGATIDLFLSTFAAEWLEQAVGLADAMLDRFAAEDGTLYFTGPDHDRLVARPRSAHDGATPSGNGLAARGLARLGRLTGEPRYERAAEAIPSGFSAQVRRHPSGFATLLLAVDEMEAEPREVVVAGAADAPATGEAIERLWRRYAPAEMVLLRDPTASDLARLEEVCPVLRDKDTIGVGGRPVFFDCRGRTCRPPTDDVDAILAP